jgi:hypothetical protein
MDRTVTGAARAVSSRKGQWLPLVLKWVDHEARRAV